jgi:hypothetical protein
MPVGFSVWWQRANGRGQTADGKRLWVVRAIPRVQLINGKDSPKLQWFPLNRRQLRFAVCRLPFAVCRLSLPSAVCRLPSAASFWHYFFSSVSMANKSSKSPSGEEREQSNEHIRKQEVEAQDIKTNAGIPRANRKAKQENLQNRGYEEDQPHNPVRNSGSTKREQETLPTGEPDPDES